MIESKLTEKLNDISLEEMLEKYERLSIQIDNLEWERKMLKSKIKRKGGEI